MTDPVLERLAQLMSTELPGLTASPSGLEAVRELRYGRVPVMFDYDAETKSIRVYARVPVPPGAGPDFLIWCLTTSTLYWDVKIGLDEAGMLIVHGDVDCDRAEVEFVAQILCERVDAIGELLDEDLVPYQLDHQLCTPAQATRWRGWEPD
jgi:hypothetical protein